MTFLNFLINGISLGSIYAIIALGYTMVYGIAKMLNFAHGDVIMVGAYVCFYAMFQLQPAPRGGHPVGHDRLYPAGHAHRAAWPTSPCALPPPWPCSSPPSASATSSRTQPCCSGPPTPRSSPPSSARAD